MLNGSKNWRVSVVFGEEQSLRLEKNIVTREEFSLTAVIPYINPLQVALQSL